MTPEDMDKVDKLVSHIRNVQESCHRLSRKLMEKGEFKLGRHLVAISFLHDNSKFAGLEWDALVDGTGDKRLLAAAIAHHGQVNPHHPEYWDGGIHGMPRIFLAELVADWKARSAEKGTSLRDWIDGEAMKRFNFKKDDEVYKTLMEFVDMVLDPPFKPVEAQ